MRTIVRLLVVYTLVVSARAQFLVKDQEYRCPPSDHVCQSTNPHHLSSFEQHVTATKHVPYTTNYVEYNDHGQPWNPRQLDDALDRLRSARGTDGTQSALVVVYIHGWQNNADDNPSSCQDVCRFDKLLAHLADEQTGAPNPLQVVGIYLAWRGLTFTIEPFKHIVSYWPRRSVARRVGQTGMYQALTRIESTVEEHRQSYVVVLAGHSFGARVLENAAETKDKKHTGFMIAYRNNVQRAARARAAASLANPQVEALALNPSLPADLIFYVNAATASTVTRQVLKQDSQTCAADPHARICGANPFYIAVTSHADLATGIIMPIANLVFPALTSDGLHLFSAANTPWLHTHNDPVPGCQPNASVCFTVNSSTPPGTESITPIAGRQLPPGSSSAPFWIFNVGKEVIKDHGDVWNDSVIDLVTNIIKGNPQYQTLSRRLVVPVK